MPSIAEQIVALQAENARLSVDLAFGILTSQAIRIKLEDFQDDRMAAVYLDIDGLGEANKLYGHEGVNAKIKAAFRQRKHEAALLGRWYSGDEIVAIVPCQDAGSFARHLLKSFQRQDLSCTIGVVNVDADILEAIASAAQLCHSLKNGGDKGVIAFSFA